MQQAADDMQLLWVDGRATGLRIRVCTSFRARLVGWGRGPDAGCSAARADVDRGIWLQPCAAIHTLWLRSAIDVAFIGPFGRVQRVCAAVRPGQVRVCRGAHAVLELPSGALAACGVAPGVNVSVMPAR